MRRLSSLVVPLAAVALVAAVATGCSTSARPTATGGVAAVVGDATVPASLLEDRLRTSAPDLRAALAQQAQQQGGGTGQLDAETLAARSRSLLSQAVLHRLIGAESTREGIVVPPAAVEARLAQSGGAQALTAGSGYDEATVRELVGDQIAAAEIGRRVFDRLAVTLDYATVPTRADADALAARIAADPAGPAVAELPPDRAVTGVTLRPGSDQGSGAGSAASSLLFGLPANTVTVTSSAQRSSATADTTDPATEPWTVVHVRERTLDAAPPGAGVLPAAQVDEDTMVGFGLRVLQPVAGELGVSVNPRFGTWDPSQLQVVAPPDAAGVVTPVAPVPPLPRSPVPAAPAPAATPAPAPPAPAPAAATPAPAP